MVEAPYWEKLPKNNPDRIAWERSIDINAKRIAAYVDARHCGMTDEQARAEANRLYP